MPLRALIIAVVIVLAPGDTIAGEGQGVSGSAAMAVAAWVSEATDLPMPDAMPEIRFAAPEDMPRLMGSHPPPSASEGPSEIVAFYEAQARVIHLPSGWTGSTPGELSILVHEMVHHAQTESGRHFACPAERERQAYDAQIRWLALFGSDLKREFGIDRMFLLVATSCGTP